MKKYGRDAHMLIEYSYSLVVKMRLNIYNESKQMTNRPEK